MKLLKNSYKRKHERDIVLFILVSIFLVTSETWLFKANILFKYFEITSRILIPMMLIIFFRKYAIPYKGKKIFIFYMFIVFYLLLISLFSENSSLVFINTVKFLYILAFPIAFLLILHPNNFSYSFLYIPVYLGLFFSLQTIILFILIQTGNPPPSNIVTLIGYKNMEVLSYGFWGYAHSMIARGTPFQVYRATSFFGEPTILASFLEVSTILSFGLYKIKKNKKMLIISFICLISIILSFSMTAYIVIFLIIIFCYFVKFWKKLPLLVPSILIIIIPLTIFIIVTYLNVATGDNFYSLSKLGYAFGHSPKSITSRTAFIVDSLRVFRDYPFGIGLIEEEGSLFAANYLGALQSRMAPFFWTTIAGVIGLIVQTTIIFFLFKSIIIKRVKNYNKIEQYINLSLLATILHQCLAGNWFNSIFFYLLICIIATDAYQFSFYSGQYSK
jgi:hypothetical protein